MGTNTGFFNLTSSSQWTNPQASGIYPGPAMSVPADFKRMISVEVIGEPMVSWSSLTDDEVSVSISIGLTGTNSFACMGANSSGLPHAIIPLLTSSGAPNAVPAAFTFVNTTSNKLSWDACEVYYHVTYDNNMGGDGGFMSLLPNTAIRFEYETTESVGSLSVQEVPPDRGVARVPTGMPIRQEWGPNNAEAWFGRDITQNDTYVYANAGWYDGVFGFENHPYRIYRLTKNATSLTYNNYVGSPNANYPEASSHQFADHVIANSTYVFASGRGVDQNGKGFQGKGYAFSATTLAHARSYVCPVDEVNTIWSELLGASEGVMLIGGRAFFNTAEVGSQYALQKYVGPSFSAVDQQITLPFDSLPGNKHLNKFHFYHDDYVVFTFSWDDATAEAAGMVEVWNLDDLTFKYRLYPPSHTYPGSGNGFGFGLAAWFDTTNDLLWIGCDEPPSGFPNLYAYDVETGDIRYTQFVPNHHNVTNFFRSRYIAPADNILMFSSSYGVWGWDLITQTVVLDNLYGPSDVQSGPSTVFDTSRNLHYVSNYKANNPDFATVDTGYIATREMIGSVVPISGAERLVANGLFTYTVNFFALREPGPDVATILGGTIVKIDPIVLTEKPGGDVILPELYGELVLSENPPFAPSNKVSIAPTGMPNIFQPQFGTAIRGNSTRIFVTAEFQALDVSGLGRGALYVFDRTTKAFIERQDYSPVSGDDESTWGRSLAVDDSGLLVSRRDARYNLSSVPNLIPLLDPSDLSTIRNLTNSRAEYVTTVDGPRDFGSSVALTTTYAVVGNKTDRNILGTKAYVGTISVFNRATGAFVTLIEKSTDGDYGSFWGSPLAATDSIIVAGTQEVSSLYPDVSVFDTATGALLQTITPPNTVYPGGSSTNDGLGYAIDVNENYIALVASNDQNSSSFSNKGTLYIYSATTYALLWSFGPAGRNNYKSVSLSGDRVAVGGHGLNLAAYSTNRGVVRVFDLISGSMIQEYYEVQDPAFESTLENFGASVSLDGTEIFIGASTSYRTGSNEQRSGAFYYGDTSSSTLTKVTPPYDSLGEGSDSRFGTKILATEKYLIASAPGVLSQNGRVYAIDKITNLVVHEFVSAVTAYRENHYFGRRMVLDQDRDLLYIGTETLTSDVYVYDLANNFSLVRTFAPTDPEFDRAPASAPSSLIGGIAISSNYLFIGAGNTQGLLGDNGSGVVFVLDRITYAQIAVIENPSATAPAFDYFGGRTIYVSEDENRLVVGANNAGSGTNNTGAIHVFDMATFSHEWTFNTRYSDTAILWSEIEDRVVVVGDKMYLGQPEDDRIDRNYGAIQEYDLATGTWVARHRSSDLGIGTTFTNQKFASTLYYDKGLLYIGSNWLLSNKYGGNVEVVDFNTLALVDRVNQGHSIATTDGFGTGGILKETKNFYVAALAEANANATDAAVLYKYDLAVTIDSFSASGLVFDSLLMSLAVQETGEDQAAISLTIIPLESTGDLVTQETGADTLSGTGSALFPIFSNLSALEMFGKDDATFIGLVPGLVLNVQETGQDLILLSVAVGVAEEHFSVREANQDQASFNLGALIDGSLSSQDAGQDQTSINFSVQLNLQLAAIEENQDLASFELFAVTGLFFNLTEVGSDLANASSLVFVDGSLSQIEPGKDNLSVSGAVDLEGILDSQSANQDIVSFFFDVVIGSSLSVQEVGVDTLQISSSVVTSVTLVTQDQGEDTATATGFSFIAGSVVTQEAFQDESFIAGSVFIEATLESQEIGQDAALLTSELTAEGSLTTQEPFLDVAAVTGTVAFPERFADLASVELNQDIAEFDVGVEVLSTLQAQDAGVDTPSFFALSLLEGSFAVEGQNKDLLLSSGTLLVVGDLVSKEIGSDYSVADVDLEALASISVQEQGVDQLASSASVTVSLALDSQEQGSDQTSTNAVVDVLAVMSTQDAGLDVATLTSEVLVSGAFQANLTQSDTIVAEGQVALVLALAVQDQGIDEVSITLEAFTNATLLYQEINKDTLSGSLEATITLAVVGVEPNTDQMTLSGTVDVDGYSLTVEPNRDLSLIAGAILISGFAYTRSNTVDEFTSFVRTRTPLRKAKYLANLEPIIDKINLDDDDHCGVTPKGPISLDPSEGTLFLDQEIPLGTESQFVSLDPSGGTVHLELNETINLQQKVK